MARNRTEPALSLPKTWSGLDLGLHAYLAVNPLALGLWTFSLAPLVGGNLLLAVVLGGVVMFVGAVVAGALADSRPWTGGDYAWQTRLLDAHLGVVLTLTSWVLAVWLLAPVYGNVLRVQVLQPFATQAGWDGVESWLAEENGAFLASLIAIAVATAFAGLGMRRAALVQRAVVVGGLLALLVVLGLLLTSSTIEARDAFNREARETFGTGGITATQIREAGRLDAQLAEVDAGDSFRLVPTILLFALWIGWATPLAGEVRRRTGGSARLALVRAAIASTLTSILLFVAIGRSLTWDLWNEAANLYWGTVYGTTSPTPIPAWPSPVVFAAWLVESTAAQLAIIAAMSLWVLGWTMTLFLPATRVLLAAASDRVLPDAVARPSGALAVLVVPACAFAALDAYSDTYAGWAAVAVAALGLTVAGSAAAAFVAFRRESRGLALVSALYAVVVLVVVGAWLLDPVYGLRELGPIVFLLALYGLAAALYVLLRRPGSPARSPIPLEERRTSRRV